MTAEECEKYLRIQEISQQEFCDHIEDDDLLLAYGNPLIIRRDVGKRLLVVAWPLWKRQMEAAGRGMEVDAIEEAVRRATEQHIESKSQEDP